MNMKNELHVDKISRTRKRRNVSGDHQSLLAKSRHASERMAQRAIPDSMIPLIFGYGEEIHQKGGATKFRVPRREASRMRRDLKRVLAHLDSLQDVYLVVSDDGALITAAHENV